MSYISIRSGYYGLVYDIQYKRFYKDGDGYTQTDNNRLLLAAVPRFGYGVTEIQVRDTTTGQYVVERYFSPILDLTIDLDHNYEIWFYFGERARLEGTSVSGLYTTSTYIEVPAPPLGKFTEEIQVKYSAAGYVLQPFSLPYTVRYSAGAEILPVYNYQNIKVGEETWTRVYASPASDGSHPARDYLDEVLVRYFKVHEGTAYILVLTRIHPYTVRMLKLDLDTGDWSVAGEFDISAPARDIENKVYPEFGSVAEGHGGIVFATTTDAVYFPLQGDGEPLRLPFVSSEYHLAPARWGTRCVLTVPEGFLFLPQGILWDMDTFWNFPTNIDVSDNDRLIPVYFEGVAGVAVRTGEYGTNGASDSLKAFYIWGGMEKGLVKANVGADQKIGKPYPMYLGGSLVNKQFFAFNAYAQWEESTFLQYILQKDETDPSDMTKWVLKLVWVQPVLPLPFMLPKNIWKPPSWGELWGWCTENNSAYIYFPRIWDRIYRIDPTSKEMALAHIVPYLDFSGNSILRRPEEEEAQVLLKYEPNEGRLYVLHLRDGGRIQIWRQSVSFTPPPAPNITFPPNNTEVPRKFEVIFQPFAYSYPQEFAVRFGVSTSSGYMTFEFNSILHRNLFMVSWDGGNTYQEMTGAITVGENDDVRVRFDLPIYLPQSSTVTVTVFAVGVIQ